MQRTPHLILLNHAFYNLKLKPLLALWMGAWFRANRLLVLSDAELLEYLLHAQPHPMADAFVLRLQTVVSETQMKMLNLSRDWLHMYLPHVLSKVNRVHYGLLSSQEIEGVERHPLPPRTPCRLQQGAENVWRGGWGLKEAGGWSKGVWEGLPAVPHPSKVCCALHRMLWPVCSCAATPAPPQHAPISVLGTRPLQPPLTPTGGHPTHPSTSGGSPPQKVNTHVHAVWRTPLFWRPELLGRCCFQLSHSLIVSRRISH